MELPSTKAATTWHYLFIASRFILCMLLCERKKRGSNHLFHLPEIQSGMENSHPPPIYTSSLTSPWATRHLCLLDRSCTILTSMTLRVKCSPEPLLTVKRSKQWSQTKRMVYILT